MLNRALTEQPAAQYPAEPGQGVSDRFGSERSPFVVGASGHRNLAGGELARARKDVATFLDTIRALLPDTEFTLMLGMTAGGDLMVAETEHTWYVMPDVPLKNLLMLCAGIMALFLGAWKLHQSKMATRELIWQYKNQLAHFARSSSELERTAAPGRRTELLVELGRRSLMESYLWTIHRYHREHAPPAGG